jgi:DNA-binding protein HU-beta
MSYNIFFNVSLVREIYYNSMNYKELQQTIANRLEISQEDVDMLIGAMNERIVSILSEGNSVGMQGFGILEVRKKQQRLVVNPQTQKHTIVPPKMVVNFKPSNAMKEKSKSTPRYE